MNTLPDVHLNIVEMRRVVEFAESLFSVSRDLGEYISPSWVSNIFNEVASVVFGCRIFRCNATMIPSAFGQIKGSLSYRLFQSWRLDGSQRILQKHSSRSGPSSVHRETKDRWPAFELSSWRERARERSGQGFPNYIFCPEYSGK